MKVLQINNYHYVRGGSDKLYLETSQLLRENQIEVCNFSIGDSKNITSACSELFPKYFAVDLNGSIWQKIKSFPRFIYSSDVAKKLENLIRLHKPDIAHLHIFYGRITSSILPVLKKYNIPVVMTVHEYKMLCPAYLLLDSKNKKCEDCAGGKYYNCIIKRCCKNKLSYSIVQALESYVRDIFFAYEKYIDKFIMPSQFILDKHLSGKKLSKDKVVKIYNFADSTNKQSVNHDSDYYLYFGRLSHEKGILTLINAFQKLKNLKLIIVGTGLMESQICELLAKTQSANIELLGYKSGSELENIVKDSKYVIVPSEWLEPFGMVISEAYSNGIPVIGANIGGISEIVQNEKTGFTFDSGSVDSLLYTIRRAENISTEDYQKMSQQAYQFYLENFTKEIYFQKLLKVYEEVIAAK